MTSPPRLARRWVLAFVAAWTVALVGAGGYAVTHPQLTDREQSTVAQARPSADEAVARMARAASASGAVVAVSAFDHVGTCDITVFRSGDRYRRSVTAVVAPGTETDLLRRVAGLLPASYGAVVRGGTEPRLTADAGRWVLVTATRTAPGEVVFSADTGDCRPAGAIDPADRPPAPSASGAADEAIAAALAVLDRSAANRTVATVACPDGGSVSTVRVNAPAYPGALDAALAALDGTAPVVTAPRLYAYRVGQPGPVAPGPVAPGPAAPGPGDTGPVEVAVHARPDATEVTATVGCPGA